MQIMAENGHCNVMFVTVCTRFLFWYARAREHFEKHRLSLHLQIQVKTLTMQRERHTSTTSCGKTFANHCILILFPFYAASQLLWNWGCKKKVARWNRKMQPERERQAGWQRGLPGWRVASLSSEPPQCEWATGALAPTLPPPRPAACKGKTGRARGEGQG